MPVFLKTLPRLLWPLPPSASFFLALSLPPPSLLILHLPPSLPHPLGRPSNPTVGPLLAYALHHTRLHPLVTFAALYLLQRLKARFPAAKSFSKIICNNTYSNKSWCIVGQGMLASLTPSPSALPLPPHSASLSPSVTTYFA
jgi:hypothetical protein